MTNICMFVFTFHDQIMIPCTVSYFVVIPPKELRFAALQIQYDILFFVAVLMMETQRDAALRQFIAPGLTWRVQK